jgi:hypothetical protein
MSTPMAPIDEFRFLVRALGPFDDDEWAAEALRDDLASGDWEGIIALASQQLVTPTLHQALHDKGLLGALPEEVRDYLEAVHTLNGARNRRIADQTAEITAALNEAGIEPILLKGVAHLFAGLYGDPAARVIGDIDLLVSSERIDSAVAALAGIGYRVGDVEGMSFAEHHHHPPLVRADAITFVELHTEPLYQAFGRLMSAADIMAAARPVAIADQRARLPSTQHQLVLNIAHTQLSDRHFWSGRASLRGLMDLVLLRARAVDAVVWQDILDAFERSGHGNACRTYLMLAERLLGQAAPRELHPTLGARLACWRVDRQRRSRRRMAIGVSYGFYRALLAELVAGQGARRRVLNRLLHPDGFRRSLQALRNHLSRAD